MSNPKQSELDEILEILAADLNIYADPSDDSPTPFDEAKQTILDWHNKQVEAVIKKPHILPQNAQHLESVKQGINFYHRQMRKRIDKLKETI